MKMFDQKVVVVTGAGSGIGQAAALLFAGRGARVCALDQHAVWAQKTIEMIQRENGLGMAVQADVTCASEVARSVDAVLERFGSIDILVNNAAIEFSADVIHTPEKDWDRVIAVNLKGAFLMSKEVLPAMKKQERGAIVNVSSISGLLGWPNSAVYCASKGGIIQLTRQMAVDYSPSSIRVNCVCPGTTLTPMIERLFDGEADREQTMRKISAMHPLGRFARPSEIAEAICFLASEDASFITGAVLPVDGGYTAQ